MAASSDNHPSVVKIVGIGGAGSNIVEYMLSNGIPDAEFIVMNTDSVALKTNPCPQKVLLEHRGKPEGPLLGRQSVIESQDRVEDAIFDARSVIFVAGLGGNTATGALPPITEIAKEMDFFVVCMVIMPFAFEGEKRTALAQECLGNLEKTADALIVFQNEEFRKNIPPNKPMAENLLSANETLLRAARYIAGLLDRNSDEMDEQDFQRLCDEIRNHDYFSGACQA